MSCLRGIKADMPTAVGITAISTNTVTIDPLYLTP